MPGLWFPDLQSFDWCLEIRPAVAVLSTSHEDDPTIVRDHFAERCPD
jgi:hypothetical protein